MIIWRIWPIANDQNVAIHAFFSGKIENFANLTGVKDLTKSMSALAPYLKVVLSPQCAYLSILFN